MSADKTVEKKQPKGRSEAEEFDELDDEDVEDRSITAGKGRATPSRRRQGEEEESGNFLTRTIRGLREYFEGVRSELEKVIWPTREEVRRLTIIVLVTLVISSLILGAISLFFTELFKIGLTAPIVLLVTMIVGVVVGIVVLRISNREERSRF